MAVFNSLNQNSTDLYGTPKEMTDLLVPYLDKSWTIWEPCAGFGAISNHLIQLGFKVEASDIRSGKNALQEAPYEFDCVVTNPPFSKKTEFLARCLELCKPFVLLLPCDLVNQSRFEYFKDLHVQLIIPNRRVQFLRFDNDTITKATSPNLGCVWVCVGLNLPQDILWRVLV